MRNLTLCLLACLLTISSFAQYPKKFVWVPTGRMNNVTLLAFNSAYSNYKNKYFVLRKDSSGIIVNSQILRDADGKWYLYEEAREHGKRDTFYIPAFQTFKITYQDQRKPGQVIEGIATDTCWLFKVMSGKINLYSPFPPPDLLTNEVVIAYQIGDNPIEQVDVNKLKVIMQDNKKALEALEKKDYIKAARRYND